ncbi:replicative DNA helicase [Methylohalomonas lacus]|uniref:Replicative DNA helicase n=1 Tax=Methylohalomonas lacus TaxID=398773 RepID=A0AAE3HHK2_9GAMM|nr:replicative DNA helicase [Methylohalomonas lacus]MCS3902404.1 replicative DNA helicase [Methylohalomonas lacus]
MTSPATSDITKDRSHQSFKVPPHSVPAEQSVLGGLLLDNRAWDEISEQLSEEDFYRKDHRLIFRAIGSLINEGRPCDVITLSEWLDKSGLLNEAGGHDYLAALAENIPSAANVKSYAGIVRESSVLRQVIDTGYDIAGAGLNPEGRTSEQVLDFAESSVFRIAEQESRGRRNYRSITTLLTAALDKVDELYRSNSHITGIETGYKDFDEMTAGLQKSDLVIVAGRPSMGKAQPLDAKIRTQDGWKTMGDLRMGDRLASVDGRPSRVAGVFPQGTRDIYRITFSDGRSTEVCDEHLWKVHHRLWDKARTISTAKISELLTRKRYQDRLWIDHCSGDFGASRSLPVEPWVLGLLLGDGNLKGSAVRFSSASQELLDTFAESLGAGYQLRAAGGYDYRVVQSGGAHRVGQQGVSPNLLMEALKSLSLWETGAESKFVPECYKNADKSTRLALLRGLLDTDGWIEAWGSIRFATVSRQLADDVVELARSLGGWATKRVRQNRYTYKGERRTGRDAWVVNIHYSRPRDLFTLPAKQDRVIPKIKRQRMPVIKSVEWVRKAPAQCISVTHPDNLYITDDYVVTHNTAFAINIAEHVAIKGEKSVAIFSMEMPGEQLAMRMLGSLSRIDQQKIRTGNIGEDDWPRLTATLTMMQNRKMFIDDAGGLTPSEVRSRCRRIKREHGLDMVIVDYLQLMQMPENSENRATELSAISRGLKSLAKELNVPVIALSQLNRSLEQRDNKRPRMSDLRESGAIEQDADVIVFIYRDEVYNEDSQDKGKAEIIISKQRNGPIGECFLAFRGQYTRFENYIDDSRFSTGDYG